MRPAPSTVRRSGKPLFNNLLMYHLMPRRRLVWKCQLQVVLPAACAGQIKLPLHWMNCSVQKRNRGDQHHGIQRKDSYRRNYERERTLQGKAPCKES